MTIVKALNDHIVGLQHIGHIVTDLDAAVAAFCQLYGVDSSVVRRVPASPDDSAPTLFAFIPVGDTEFELIQAQSDEARAVLHASPVGGAGINHVAWRVDDINACVALLAAQGVTPGHVTADGIVDTGRSKIVYLDPRHTDGMLIELVQIDDRTGRAVQQ